jgi:hypothetical protein
VISTPISRFIVPSTISTPAIKTYTSSIMTRRPITRRSLPQYDSSSCPPPLPEPTYCPPEPCCP